MTPNPDHRSQHNLTLDISETSKDTAIDTTECQQKTVPKLSNGSIFNDLQ